MALIDLPCGFMGFIKDSKALALGKEAARAIEEERTVFAPMLAFPATRATMSGSVPGWAEMIEAVEANGWRLAEWAVTSDNRGHAQAFPLFRR